MTDIIDRIKQHLLAFKETRELKVDHLSDKDVASYKQSTIAQVSDESEFRRNWIKLSFNQKINRLMIYHRHISDEYRLIEKQQEQLKTLFFELANSNILDEKDIINYDNNEGTILGINGLKQSTTGDFFLASVKTKSKTVASAPFGSMKPISLQELSNANKTMPETPVKAKETTTVTPHKTATPVKAKETTTVTSHKTATLVKAKETTMVTPHKTATLVKAKETTMVTPKVTHKTSTLVTHKVTPVAPAPALVTSTVTPVAPAPVLATSTVTPVSPAPAPTTPVAPAPATPFKTAVALKTLVTVRPKVIPAKAPVVKASPVQTPTPATKIPAIKITVTPKTNL
jgi:hypothetical protein